MGAGGMYPSHSYPDNYVDLNFPYQNPLGHPIPGQVPSYGYPPNYGPGFPRPYHPMNSYGYHPGMHPNQMMRPGYFPLSRPGFGVSLPSIPPPPPMILHGNMYLNRSEEYRSSERRPDEHRSAFDEQ